MEMFELVGVIKMSFLSGAFMSIIRNTIDSRKKLAHFAKECRHETIKFTINIKQTMAKN